MHWLGSVFDMANRTDFDSSCGLSASSDVEHRSIACPSKKYPCSYKPGLFDIDYVDSILPEDRAADWEYFSYPPVLRALVTRAELLPLPKSPLVNYPIGTQSSLAHQNPPVPDADSLTVAPNRHHLNRRTLPNLSLTSMANLRRLAPPIPAIF
ncbi:hypothetical protein MJO28_012012 [Puccinia striiformis f. sp. tritici]|uniref:Uncharacterized protein n=1 Tax=Puccinia striiformis f. sp. tritici TaxID=168172 RepID=A0ACC0DZ27_9BASI|nr:hypothetical protein MJO28_012012 [Puccinia striiformis f. sp. tritici]